MIGHANEEISSTNGVFYLAHEPYKHSIEIVVVEPSGAQKPVASFEYVRSGRELKFAFVMPEGNRIIADYLWKM